MRSNNISLTELLLKLEKEEELSYNEWLRLISGADSSLAELAAEKARARCLCVYGRSVYIRGLIEFTSYCKNDCFYCGLRRSNLKAKRYRLDEDEILNCAKKGYEAGFRTFVLQGGEDPFFTDERLCKIVSRLKSAFPDCAVTLSVGERSRESYRRLLEAGGERYLLRHESANAEHYSRLHPKEQRAYSRRKCLFELRELGWQTGSGFMVGSPFQTAASLAEDMLFLKELNPHMVGIGPFIPHRDTPFCNMPRGSPELCLFMLSLIRLMLPKTLIPSTTALNSSGESFRVRGILAGANVIMPNLTPAELRESYSIYDRKLCDGAESAEGLPELKREMQGAGREIVKERGDSKLPVYPYINKGVFSDV